MKNKTCAVNIVLLIVVAAVISSLVVLSFFDESKDAATDMYSSSVNDFSEGWQFVAADGSVAGLALPAVVSVQKNEVVSISKALPQKIVEGSAIAFRTTAQTVYVYVDGIKEPVYEYNTVPYQLYGKATQNTWNTVYVSENYSGKTITIKLLSPYAQYSGQLNSIYFGDRAALQSYITKAALPAYFLSFFVLFFGVLLIIYFLFLPKRKRESSSFLYLAEFIIVISFLLKGESLLPIPMLLSNFIELQISFAALYLAPLPYILLSMSRCRGKYYKIYQAFFYLFLVNTAIAVVLQVTNTYDFYEIIYIHFFLLILLFAYTWFVLIKRVIHHETPSLSLEVVGFSCLTVGSLCEMLRIIIISYNGSRLFLAAGIVIYIFCQIIIVAKRLRIEADKSAQLAVQLEESKITLMMSQIRPHFLYNTLGAIRTMIISNPDVAYKMTYDFSNYLRANMRALELTSPIPFKEELAHVEAYTNIEKVRFGDRLCVVFDMRVTDFSIPAISVQPLVENAIKHGVCKNPDGGTVVLKTRETMDSYMIIVSDNGAGFDTENIEKNKGSYGIRNLRYRLSVMVNATLSIKSEIGQGTTAIIILPKKQ